MFQSRTNTCGELRLTDAGKQVTLAGWLENVREVVQILPSWCFVITTALPRSWWRPRK